MENVENEEWIIWQLQFFAVFIYIEWIAVYWFVYWFMYKKKKKKKSVITCTRSVLWIYFAFFREPCAQ